MNAYTNTKWIVIVDTLMDNEQLTECNICGINEQNELIFIDNEQIYESKMDKMDDYCGFIFMCKERVFQQKINGI